MEFIIFRFNLFRVSRGRENQSECSEDVLCELPARGCRPTHREGTARRGCGAADFTSASVGCCTRGGKPPPADWGQLPLCTHKINQLSSLDLGPTAFTHPDSSLLNWKGLGSTLEETTKLYSSFCDSACEIVIKIMKAVKWPRYSGNNYIPPAMDVLTP